MTTPTTPTDHRRPADEAFDAALRSEELLADLPPVKPAHKFRIKQRNATIRLGLELDGLFSAFKSDPNDATDYSGLDEAALIALAEERELDTDNADTVEDLIAVLKKDDATSIDLSDDQEAMFAVMEFAEKVDEWAETNIAIDPEAYREWSEGKGHDVFFALINGYAGVLGK